MNILVVDDHPLFRDGFGHMVRALRPQWAVQFSDNAEAALAACAQTMASLVVIDVGLPGDDGFVLLQKIADISPSTPQLLMSGRDDSAVRMRARAIGARGFIAKTNAPEAIIDAIDIVLAGGSVFDHPAGELPSLTPRQIEVLMLLAEGHGNKEIRHRLNIAERTVRAHLTEIFQMLGAHSRMQALLRARELGLIP